MNEKGVSPAVERELKKFKFGCVCVCMVLKDDKFQMRVKILSPGCDMCIVWKGWQVPNVNEKV